MDSYFIQYKIDTSKVQNSKVEYLHTGKDWNYNVIPKFYDEELMLKNIGTIEMTYKNNVKKVYKPGDLVDIRELRRIKVSYDSSVTFLTAPKYISELEYINTENFIMTKKMFKDCTLLKTINNNVDGLKWKWALENVIDMSFMFENCSKLEEVDFGNILTYKLKNIKGLFYRCTSLRKISLGTMDINSVDDEQLPSSMGYLFAGCMSLEELDLTGFDIKHIRYLQCLFTNCSSLKKLDLSNWDTSAIRDASFMFHKIPSDIDWCYNGINYSNWTLTEKETDFTDDDGTPRQFPWNKK